MQPPTRISILVFLLTSGAAAQPFQDLSTTADGSADTRGADMRAVSPVECLPDQAAVEPATGCFAEMKVMLVNRC